MSNIAGASTEVKFGDKSYQMSPLDDKDVAEIDNWLRSRVIRIARDSLTADMDEDTRQLIMGAAISHVSTLSMLSSNGAKTISSIDGFTRLMWQGIRKNHPDVTEAEIRKELTDPKNLRTMLDEFDLINEGAKKNIQKRKRKLPGKRKKKTKRKSIDNSVLPTAGLLNR